MTSINERMDQLSFCPLEDPLRTSRKERRIGSAAVHGQQDGWMDAPGCSLISTTAVGLRWRDPVGSSLLFQYPRWRRQQFVKRAEMGLGCWL